MKYISTRNKQERVSAAQAIVAGMAPDGGLYLPESIPALERAEFDLLKEKDYVFRAAYLMQKYLDEFTQEELTECAAEAYAKFDGDPAPTVKLDEGLYMLELWHGPTLAFKDVALTLLPRLLALCKKKLGITSDTKILVATSGDTGKAALEGFKEVPGTSVTVFYPSDGVSQMQKLQMMTQEGSNLSVYGVKGNFDDCQSAVKALFADEELAAACRSHNVTLSSANSINWGRLLPQIVYYVSSYLDLWDEGQIAFGDPVDFCVPTGNFGNILAGWYAAQMGLPVAKLICASNENRVLFDFFRTGTYDRNRPFKLTTSPSMDILISSNLERLIYQICGRDAGVDAALMAGLQAEGRYTVTEAMKEQLSDFAAGYATEEETADTIRRVYERTGYVMDTHTAVAARVYGKYREETGDGTKTVIASTASPYKFVKSVLAAIDPEAYGRQEELALLPELERLSCVEMPRAVQEILCAQVRHTRECDADRMRETVEEILGLN